MIVHSEVGKTPEPPSQAEADAESIRANWRSMLIGGVPHYWDHGTQLWHTLDEAVRNVEGRRRFRGVMGDTKYTAIANRYEKGRGL